jgi:hypothetical protein
MRNASPGVAGAADDLSHLSLAGEVSVGSTVQCTMKQANRIFKGEVMAFDPSFKAIILSECFHR